MHTQSSVPAVVVGGSLNGLGVVRSLARDGVDIYLIETNRKCPAAWSRFCTLVRAESLDGEALLRCLEQLSTTLGVRAVLILTDEPAVCTVSAQRVRLAPLYHFDLPEPTAVEMLSDKVAFQQWAEVQGLPVPRSRALHSEADLSTLDALGPPLVLKPADKRLVLAGLVERAVRVENLDEARRVAAGMLCHTTSLIAQEWIEGPDSDIYFVLFWTDQKSRAAALFPGRKLVCSPPAVGSTAICMAAPELAEPLCAITRDFLTRVDYRGFGSVEFKRDVRSGRLLIIEPTVGRTDWQEEIATLCGVNLPLLAYQTALKIAPQLDSVPSGKPLVWRSDWRIPLPPKFPPRTRVIDGHFRWADPLPAVYYYGHEQLAQRIARRLSRSARHIFTNLGVF